MSRDATAIAPPEVKTEYEVFSRDDVANFNKKLNEMVLQGWTVDGELVVAMKTGSGCCREQTIFAQRMVRTHDR